MLAGDGLGQVFVHFIDELGAELDHFFHRAIHGELAVLIAVDAIVFVLGAVGVRTLQLFGQRHAAALTKLLFHNTSVCFGKDTNSAAESVSLGDENGKASVPALPAGERAHPVPGEFPAPAASLVHAILLSQLDQ